MSTAAERNEAMADEVQAAVESLGFSCKLRSIADTGTFYFEAFIDRDEWYPENSGSRYVEGPTSLTIRVSDHGDKYCRADYSVSPLDLTTEKLISCLNARINQWDAEAAQNKSTGTTF